MGKIQQEKEPVCLLCAITYKKPQLLEKVLKDLTKQWGCVLTVGDAYDFSKITKYYSREMGEDLQKCIVIFENLYPMNKIHQVKIFTNNLEKKYEKKGLRQVNLDPGYLNEAKVVLFSSKDFFHRIYIDEGIFGEVTLTYKSQKGFTPMSWTFSDYQNIEQIQFFNEQRKWYRLMLGRKRQKKYHKSDKKAEDIYT